MLSTVIRESVVQASAPWTWPKVRSRHLAKGRMEEKLLEAETTCWLCVVDAYFNPFPRA